MNNPIICTQITTCITKIDGTIIDDVEDLDLAIPMCNLIEYSWNYSDTAGSLWFYSKDEATDYNADIVYTDPFKSLKYKSKLLGDTENEILRNATIPVSLNYLSNLR